MTTPRSMLLILLAGTLYTSASIAQPADVPAAAPAPAPAPAPAADPAIVAPAAAPGVPASTPAPSIPGATPPPRAPAASGIPASTPVPTPEIDNRDENGRRRDMGEPIKLAFNSVRVEQLLTFIAESTGKAVMPQQEILARTVAVISDRPLPRQQALDLVFLALQQRGVAVIETPDIIFLRDQVDVDRQSVPVLGPETSTLTRTDIGSIVQKIFLLRFANAANVGEVIKNSIPDFAKMAVDAESNQVLVTGPIIILQRLERVIMTLDRPQAATPVTETFQLRFADAELIAANIRDLYGANSNTQRQNQGGGQQVPNQFRFPGGGNNGGGGGGGGGNRRGDAGFNDDDVALQGPAARAATPQGGATAASAPRVIANTQQNSITVLAEPDVMAAIRRQIMEEWDQPLSEEAVVPKVYDLKNTDPVKVKAVLEGLFGNGQGTTQQRTTVGRLAGQFTFQAVPDAGRLVVVGKSPDNISVIDRIIEDLDQPMISGLPEVVELKHANAEDLAEQLNTLLAQEGTLAQIRRTDTTLSTARTGTSPFAQDGTTDTANNNQNTNTAANRMDMWWGRARVPTDNAGTSNLIAKARIVPINRQNALMVLAPTEYRRSIVEMIERLDRPGRQVLIAAVVVELSGEDALALGVRFSNAVINPTRGENSIGTNADSVVTGTKNELINSLFDTSVLNLGVNINVLLQALAETTNVKILSEPKIFTGDNQEAEFFDGQDIPFITESQPNNQGNLVQSFDYRSVGIQLRVRPRITPERDVDLKVNLQLSSITPGNTLFGGAIVDRRETTTQLIVADGQTMVISGIIRSEDSQIKRKIPLLGDIPFFGAPFTSTENARTTTELVAFITPIVVNNRTEADTINKDPRARLRSLRTELAPNRAEPEGPIMEPIEDVTPPAESPAAKPLMTTPARPSPGPE
jgi:type II secretion system protein D